MRLKNNFFLVLTALLVCALAGTAFAQFDGGNGIWSGGSAVGGISIDAKGIVKNVVVAPNLQRAKLLDGTAGDIARPSKLRSISLRKLAEALDAQAKTGKPLPKDCLFLAGMTQVKYVFADTKTKDIILAGPAEGWRINAQGAPVGMVTGKPTLQLTDLVTALRSANAVRLGGGTISCSIDPTSQGVQKMQSYLKTLRPTSNIKLVATNIEKAMGLQTITLKGVPATSHFAQVLVAADYKMKRIAMGFEKSPVAGLDSYLKMVNLSKQGMDSPRWWLEPVYGPMKRSPDGLSWELGDGLVKCMTEQGFLTQNGQLQGQAGVKNAGAEKWANTMTQKYPELAKKEAVFGQLQGCIDLAIVATIIARYQIHKQVDWNLGSLMNSKGLPNIAYVAPKNVPTKVSVLGRGGKNVLSASGGVQMNVWAMATKTELSDDVAKVSTTSLKSAPGWWWD